ncbi:tej [Drosophila busckii]|uniref:Tej n=1 Tax=Drosophila busckii TaxID=30019 RepID=A0A0M4ECW4_DROBS|nr:tej [Drosophila busckii]
MTDLSYVKKIVHSLIVSSPLRMTVEKLNRDYAEMEGTPVPFKKLGYKDINSFLCNIPDTVIVTGSGPMAMVYARAKDKTAHIQSLVQGQKKPTKKLKSSWRDNGSRNFTQTTDVMTKSFAKLNMDTLENDENEYWSSDDDGVVLTVPYKKPIDYQSSDESCDDDAIPAYADEKVLRISRPKSSEQCFPKICIDLTNESDDEQVKETETPSSAQLPTLAINQAAVTQQTKECIVEAKKEGVKTAYIEYVSSDEGNDSDAIPAYAVDDIVISMDYPKDAVRFDHRMPKRNVQECMDLSERPLVQLINVSTPHDFYFWILGEEFEKFSAMTRNMQQGPHFSLEACNYFYELVSYRWLYAKIEKINAENNTVYLVLVDPISELFMSINTSLIESGLVRRCYNP